MRVDSPFVLAFCGTLAIHMIALVAGDALVVINPPQPRIAAPRIEMVDVEIPAPRHVPPAAVKPLPAPEEKIEDKVEDKVEEKIDRTVETKRTARVEEPKQETPVQETTEDPGGGPVVQMDDLVPTKDGVPVQEGKPNKGRIGRGGEGKGTGKGSGSGTEDAPPPPPPPPVSVATIKKPAMPKGEYGYIDAGRDYPAEARRLGIEGVIKVRLIVDQAGKVRTAVLMNKLGHGLDELALTKAKQIQFEPAKDTDDKPVTSVVIWTFSMTLPK